MILKHSQIVVVNLFDHVLLFNKIFVLKFAIMSKSTKIENYFFYNYQIQYLKKIKSILNLISCISSKSFISNIIYKFNFNLKIYK